MQEVLIRLKKKKGLLFYTYMREDKFKDLQTYLEIVTLFLDKFTLTNEIFCTNY